MKRVFWVLTLCVVLSCTHAVRVQRSVLQTPNRNVSIGVYCPTNTNTIPVNGGCYPRPTLGRQDAATEAASLSRALEEAIEQAENGGSVNTTAATFSQTLVRSYARIISSLVLARFHPENEIVCIYTGEAFGSLATAFANVLVRTLAASDNEYARVAAQCFPNIVLRTSAPILQSIRSAECTDFGADFIYRIFERANYTATLTRHVADLLNGIVARNAEGVATTCSDRRSPTVVTSG